MLKRNILLIGLLALTPTLPAQTGLITTIAGTGIGGNAGVGGPAVNAQLTGLGGICVDASDNVYAADVGNNRIVRVDAVTGILTVVAGTGPTGFSGDGGPATQATLNNPRSVAIDPAGNLYISDTMNARIRRVDAGTGVITTVAGNGTSTFAGDGGPAVSASLNSPQGINFDASGNLYIADMNNDRVRRVDALTGIITTVAGNGSGTPAPDGSVASAAAISVPFWAGFDRSGNLLISEMGSGRIRSVSASTGLLGTVAGNGATTYNGDGEGASSAAIGMSPAVAVDPNGNLYFADFTGRIRRVDAVTGQILTVAGNGSGAQEQASSGGGPIGCYNEPLGDNGPATNATIDGAYGIAVTRNGNLVFSDWLDCRIRRVFLPSPYTYTNTSLSASSTSISQGQTVTFTATVSPINGSGVPTGTVQFVDQPQNLGSAVLGTTSLNNGVAVLQTSTLQANWPHRIVAYYTGDSSFNGSGSPPVSVSVSTASKPAPTVTLSAAQSQTAMNSAVAFTIGVTPPSGSTTTPTGTVEVLDGGLVAGSATLTNGQAQISVSFTSAGTHNLTAEYLGDTNYNQAFSSLVTETVSLAATTITLTSNTVSPSDYWQPITITATISPSTATGTVEFYDNGTPLAIYTASNGTSAVNSVIFGAGSHTITATYMGDTNDSPSTSNSVTQVVNKVTPTVTITADQNPATAPATITYTVRILPLSDGMPVQLLDGQTVIATGADHGPGATFSISSLAPGVHSITAVAGGDNNLNAASSTALSQTVQSKTTVSLSSQSASTTYGQPVTLTAAVSPSAGTGTVQFLDGTTSLGSVPVSGGSAVLALSSLAAGSHQIVASYSGDSIYLASQSAAWSQTVTKVSTTVALAANPASSTIGQAVQLTASVSPSTATGTVQFQDGTTVLGTAAIASETASLSISTLAAGTHSITAAYSGDSNDTPGTSGAVAVTVSKIAVTVGLSSSLNPSNAGQSVTFTATVPSAATGTVQFLDGATALGTATVSGGVAAMTTSTLAAAVHTITASYSGDASYAAASAGLTQTVKAVTATTLTAIPATAVAGQAIQLTASVSPATATGTVQFLDSATVIGAATITGGSTSISISTLAVGLHSITAIYSGDTVDMASTSGAAAVTVNKISAAVALASSLNPSVAGQSVTFTATVSPATASGTIQFKDGSTILGTVTLASGSASFSTTALTVGTHSITAVYSGDANDNAATSGTLTQTVHAALPAAPTNLAAAAASSSQINLTWTASTTSGVTYNVYSSTTAGFTPSSANRIASGLTATSYSHTGLSPSTTHYYVVTAQNSAGESTGTNQANATTQAPGLSCQVGYSITTQWNVGFGTAITIKNTGSTPINGWNLTWTWPGNQQITQSWNANYTQHGGNATLTNASWNASIAPGATITGIGFNGSYSGTNPSPTAFYLNGTLCH